MRIPLYYTFGNHMHWVDMEWLWGYDVLPSSIRDMLRLCREAGVKGNVNFDAIGYEKLAAEAPEALAELRHAVQQGQIEVVGASYGQPYGLFHGGESNIRQRVFGVRTVTRLLGVQPRTFWEEEFDFFPQLPQILCSAGYQYASLFFQWTWHTPVMPVEHTSAIWWEGMDGSRLLAVPRNALNLHQWPEDFEGLLESPQLREMASPLILQWLELMPSPDWMCRAEVILPPLRALLADPRFDIRPVTLSEFLDSARALATPRRYTLGDVFHGMSLGKNGDRMRRFSRESEHQLLAAESISAMAGFFGRPYPSWDVYPVWELEEAWRELLAAQHHDNDECEGLCGFIGVRSYERSLGLSQHVIARTMQSICRRAGGAIAYNPLGWSRDAVVTHPETGQRFHLRDLPPFGYRAITAETSADGLSLVEQIEDAATVTLRRGMLSVAVDRARGVITQITSAAFPDGALDAGKPIAELLMTRHGATDCFERADVRLIDGAIHINRFGCDNALVTITVALAPERDAIDVRYAARNLPRPDGGMNAALRTRVAVRFPYTLIHDHPYGVSEIAPGGKYLKKYPTGDWMTSKQWFEEVHNPFTALQLVDLVDGSAGNGERGLLVLHDGSQAFLRNSDDLFHILTMYDPWDEDFFHDQLDVRVRLIPHGRIDHAQRWKLAQEFTRPVICFFPKANDERAGREPHRLPPAFGCVWSDADNVAVTAFYREAALEHIRYPYVLRLVEFNGQATQVQLRLPSTIADARKTNLLGDTISRLTPTPAEPPLAGLSTWSAVTVEMRPYEIATLYLDLELGRKVTRDLDAHRDVWATVHRV
ncbi:MAG: glycosyl hydrolase-related protein [Anaerolineae bacterium]|nr:glycosyl hydrolase-related protein [Candidatus Roseilinea sp.]MDW8451523.1 glycosyl hydrolase-related protein [Anaerolineae bacterium]